MNKREFTEAFREREQCTLDHAERAVDAFIEIVKNQVRRGDAVRIYGFGTFVKSKRKARRGRNPKTGQLIQIPATWFPKFRAGKEFRQSVK